MYKNFLAEAPKFVEPKTEQHPEDGTTAEIECKVDAEPGVEIFWQFNGDTLGECECFVTNPNQRLNQWKS